MKKHNFLLMILLIFTQSIFFNVSPMEPKANKCKFFKTLKKKLRPQIKEMIKKEMIKKEMIKKEIIKKIQEAFKQEKKDLKQKIQTRNFPSTYQFPKINDTQLAFETAEGLLNQLQKIFCEKHDDIGASCNSIVTDFLENKVLDFCNLASTIQFYFGLLSIANLSKEYQQSLILYVFEEFICKQILLGIFAQSFQEIIILILPNTNPQYLGSQLCLSQETLNTLSNHFLNKISQATKELLCLHFNIQSPPNESEESIDYVPQ